MEPKHTLTRSFSKTRQEKWKDQIKKMYAGLEKISNIEDNETEPDLHGIENEFKTFFMATNEMPESKISAKFRLLFHSEILDGYFNDQHRTLSLLQRQDDSYINGETLLLRAMSIDVEKESYQEELLQRIITSILVTRCPEMIVFPKDNKDYQGITPVHLAILKEDTQLLYEMARTLQKVNEKRLPKEKMQDICAVGPVFQDTVMMAGTPLGVAALKFNEEIFSIVLRNFATGLDVTNDKGDNIIHSLIKYANVQPDKVRDVKQMLRYILNCKFIATDAQFEKNKWKIRKQARKLLMMSNKEKLNPLQLAAKRQQYEIFEIIMHNEVYHSRISTDGLFNEEVYDITELETLNLEPDLTFSDEENIKPEYHESVLEYLIHHQTSNAFMFADFIPVKEVIREKWKTYKWWFMGWFVIHLIFMILLSVAAVFRSEIQGEISVNSTAVYSYVVTKDGFVTGVSVVGLVFGLFYLFMEAARKIVSRFQFQTSSSFIKRTLRHFSTPYSNLIFRIYFVLFSLLLITDFAVAASASSTSFSGYENYCLIFSVIVGWYMVMFFLQTLKPFSFFTVLIQKVVLDMIKFAIVMAFMLVAFSIAMFMIMQGADTDVENFSHVGRTMVKMLTIMLGIGDFEDLFKARQPILAVGVFVLFVLLTTILLLNALIAMMSNSCTDLMNNYGGVVAAKLHCRLQKLSVILFLEGFFPRCICKEVGKIKMKTRYENNEWVRNKQRRIWEKSSVHAHGGTETEHSRGSSHLAQTRGIVTLIMQQLDPEIKKMKSHENKIARVIVDRVCDDTIHNQASKKRIDILEMEKETGDVYKVVPYQAEEVVEDLETVYT